MKTHIYRLLSMVALAAVGVFHCSLNDLAGGGGSDVGNGRVLGAIVTSNGNPAANTQVLLIPHEYNLVTNGPLADILIDTTDAAGAYSLKAPAGEVYHIIAVQCVTRMRLIITNINVIRNDTVYVPVDTLREAGSMKVMLPDSVDAVNGYVFIPGTTIAKLLSGSSSFVVLDSVPAGVIPAISYSSIKSGNSIIIRYDVPVIPGDTTVVWNPSWKYARRLFLNTTAGGADVPGDVYNFPVLVRLTAGNFTFAQTKTDGGDLRFTKNDGTPLPYELERFDAGSHRAEIWVRVDTVHGSDSTQSLMIYWGNPNAADNSNGAAVFDTAAGFAGVWHLGQPAGAIVPDATANGINGTATATATVSGAIGAAQSFNGTSSLVQASGLANDKVNFPDTGTYAVSAWVKTDVLDSLVQAIVFKSNAQYGMQIIPEHDWEFTTYIDQTRWEGSRSPASAGSWHALTGVRNGTKQYLYVNGVCVDSSITNTIALPPENVPRAYDMPLEIGHCPDGGRNPDRFFNGIIDEVRISSIAINVDWIKLSYMNQKDQDALVKW